jgi:hypothetical protein
VTSVADTARRFLEDAPRDQTCLTDMAMGMRKEVPPETFPTSLYSCAVLC